MASDSLNEVGKILKKTSDNADRAVKKQAPLRPSVERTRDIFDTDIPFNMEFQVSPTQKSITLDLEFNKPPPMNNCLTGGDIKAHCEVFEGLSAGDHEIQLEHAAGKNTITVFVNGATWPSSRWAVITYGILGEEPASVLVTQLPNVSNTVTICYIEPVCIRYNGEAFGALLNYGADGWHTTGDDPDAGWYPEPTVGPVISTGDYIIFNTCTTVRIECRIHFAIVPGLPEPITMGLNVTRNGYEIGSTYETFGPGLYFAAGDLYVNIDNFEVSPGDVFSAHGSMTRTPSAGGFGNLGVNETYLRVGRTTYSWNTGTVTWEGSDG